MTGDRSIARVRVTWPALRTRLALRLTLASWALSWGVLLVACMAGQWSLIGRAVVVSTILSAIVARIYALNEK